MTRLNNTTRDGIVANALKAAGILEGRADLRRRYAELAEAVRIEGWGGQEELNAAEGIVEEINALVAQLPDVAGGDAYRLGYNSTTQDVSFGGLSTVVRFSGYGSMYEEGGKSVTRAVPTCNVLLAADHPLSKEFTQLEQEAASLENRAEGIGAQVRAAVAGVTTVAKLLKAWPEAKELLPAAVTPKSTAVALPTEVLNRLIRLPTEG